MRRANLSKTAEDQFNIVKIADRVRKDDIVERPFQAFYRGEIFGVPAYKGQVWMIAPGDLDHPLAEIQSDAMGGFEAGQEVPGPAPDLKHAGVPGWNRRAFRSSFRRSQ